MASRCRNLTGEAGRFFRKPLGAPAFAYALAAQDFGAVPVEPSNTQNELELIWGASNIAKALGVSTRRAFYMLENQHVPAKKIGGRWVIDRARLTAFFRQNDEQNRAPRETREGL